MRNIGEEFPTRNKNLPLAKNDRLTEWLGLLDEWHTALSAMTFADIRELEKFGVTSRCAKFGLVGLTRINRLVDRDLYEPDPAGVAAFITPVRVEDWQTPEEATKPELFVRMGGILDLVAWDPREPDDWALRTGKAVFLGCAPPQHLDPERVWVRRTPLDWLRANCVGLVLLTNDFDRIYSPLMMFHQAGIWVEDEAHRIELKRRLERPYPVPDIAVGPPLRT